MQATYQELVDEVRAQLSVTPEQAYAWLLDRARVLNAEARWQIQWDEAIASDPVNRPTDGFILPNDLIWLEAVWLSDDRYTPAGGIIFQRSTQHAMDARQAGQTGNTAPIYAMNQTLFGLRVDPPVNADKLQIRYVVDIEDAGLSSPAPFPNDFKEALVDAAIAIGMARMDERFDAASYFDTRFATAVDRLKRRRHAQIGRGATAIRIVQ